MDVKKVDCAYNTKHYANTNSFTLLDLEVVIRTKARIQKTPCIMTLFSHDLEYPWCCHSGLAYEQKNDLTIIMNTNFS